MGVSKEQRKKPIVQMGLFMDNTGIPISIEHSWNTFRSLNYAKGTSNTIDNLNLDRFIFVGDR